jgi:hypothetical protein
MTHESWAMFTTTLDAPMLALAPIDGHNSLPLPFTTKFSKIAHHAFDVGFTWALIAKYWSQGKG